MSRTNARSQLSRGHLIAAARTVTIPSWSILPAAESNTPTEEASKDSFIRLSDGKLSDRHFDDSADECAAPKTIALSESEIIHIANTLQIDLPGLVNFRSGFYLITQKPNESAIDFAMRKLSAITPVLIQSDLAHPLNDWHMANLRDVDKSDQALAETSYYYDAINKRLIIKHTPIEATDSQSDLLSRELVEMVTQKIITALALDRSQTHIEHVVPRIIAGRLGLFTASSRHIVLQIRSENDSPKKPVALAGSDSSDDESVDSVIFDPRKNLFDMADYFSVGVQEYLNNTDCGRHVLIMATAAAKVLAENSDKNATTMTNLDFLQFSEVLNAKECATVLELKKLLMEIGDPVLSAARSIERMCEPPLIEAENTSWFSLSALVKLSFLAPTLRECALKTAVSPVISSELVK